MQLASATQHADGAGTKAKTAYGVIAGVLAAAIAGFTWLAVTHSYCTDKQMVVTEVVKNLKVADIAFSNHSAVAGAPQLNASLASASQASASQQTRLANNAQLAALAAARLRMLTHLMTVSCHCQSCTESHKQLTSSISHRLKIPLTAVLLLCRLHSGSMATGRSNTAHLTAQSASEGTAEYIRRRSTGFAKQRSREARGDKLCSMMACCGRKGLLRCTSAEQCLASQQLHCPMSQCRSAAVFLVRELEF